MLHVGHVAFGASSRAALAARRRRAVTSGVSSRVAAVGRHHRAEVPVAAQPFLGGLPVEVGGRITAVDRDQGLAVPVTDRAVLLHAQRREQRLAAGVAVCAHATEHVADPVVRPLLRRDAGARLDGIGELAAAHDFAVRAGDPLELRSRCRRPQLLRLLELDRARVDLPIRAGQRCHHPRSTPRSVR